MKIWTVTFNDGGWHSGPNFKVVAESKEEAIEKVLEDNPRYRSGYDKWASEFKIEVYDEKTYNREKNLENLDI